MSTESSADRSGFGRLWSASVASNLGDGLVLAALPLLAAGLTSDPVAISGISIAAGLPWLLIGPLAGAVVDRFDRRRLMVVFDLGRAAALLVFSVLVAADLASIWSIYVVVFLIAGGETIVDTASQAMLPALVPAHRLDWANGQLFSTMTIANRFVGPPLGGFLIEVALVMPFAADAISFAVAAVVVFTISGAFQPRPSGTLQPEAFWPSVREGLRWLWSNRPIRTFAIGAAVLNVGVMAGEAILVLYSEEQLGLSGVGFGALLAATAAGYAAGSAIAPQVARRVDRLRLIGLSVASVSLALGAIGLAQHWVVAALGLLLIGGASGVWDVIAVSYRQAVVPDRLLGRIMAAYRVIAHGSIPLGALLGGVAARTGGNRAAFYVGALVVLAALPYVVSSLRNVALDPGAAVALVDEGDPN